MRFTTTAIVASVAASHAAAGPTHNRHAALHAAREASAEPDWRDVDFSNTALYSNVDWASVFGKSGSTSTAAPAAVATPQVKAAVQPNVQPAGNTQPTQTQSSSTTHQSSTGSSNPVGNLVNGAAGSLVNSLFTNAGGLQIQAPINQGFALTGQGYTINAKNNKKSDMNLVCWHFINYDSPFVGAGIHPPGFNVKIPSGQTQSVIVPDGMSGACAPVWSDTQPAPDAGYIWNTWLEFTMTPGGVVNVSYEPNMGGDTIVATVRESPCTTSKESCGFICKSIETAKTNSCMSAGFYEITDCKGQTNSKPSETSMDGGCGWPQDKHPTIDATFG